MTRSHNVRGSNGVIEICRRFVAWNLKGVAHINRTQRRRQVGLIVPHAESERDP